MKRYKYVRMTHRVMSARYGSSAKTGRLSHREIIDALAAEGWEFKGTVPVEVMGSGYLNCYDLVFEREA